MSESAGRFNDGLNILPKAWTEERFSYSGDFYQLEDVSVVPKPLQKPHPPIFMTGTSGRGFKLAAEKGWNICCGGPAPLEVFTPAIDIYRETCAEVGTNPYVAYVRAVFLADDEATAHQEAKQAIMNFYEFNVRPHDSLRDGRRNQEMNDAGYGFYAGDLLQAMRQFSYDDLIDQQMVFVGTAEQVTRQLEDLHRDIAFDEFDMLSHYGDIDLHQAYRNQDIFAKKVIPAFR